MDDPRCAFCTRGKSRRLLISNPGYFPIRVYICDSCVEVCQSILEEELPMTNKEFEGVCDDIRSRAEEVVRKREDLELDLGEVFEFIEMNSEYTVTNLKKYYGIEEEEGEE